MFWLRALEFGIRGDFLWCMGIELRTLCMLGKCSSLSYTLGLREDFMGSPYLNGDLGVEKELPGR